MVTQRLTISNVQEPDGENVSDLMCDFSEILLQREGTERLDSPLLLKAGSLGGTSSTETNVDWYALYDPRLCLLSDPGMKGLVGCST